MTKLKKLIAILGKRRKTLALAESCSGGYATYLLTKIPGASKVIKGAIVAYSPDVKNRFLKIPLPLLKKTQGVSEEVALKLAKGVRKKFDADIGASLTGFAGPGAAKGQKVGTIFIAFSADNGKKVKKLIIKGTRDTVRKKASQLLIELIYENFYSHRPAPGSKR